MDENPITIHVDKLKECGAQIAKDAANGRQTIVVNDEGKTVMVVGTGKKRLFEWPDLSVEEWLAELLEGSDGPEPEAEAEDSSKSGVCDWLS